MTPGLTVVMLAGAHRRVAIGATLRPFAGEGPGAMTIAESLAALALVVAIIAGIVAVYAASAQRRQGSELLALNQRLVAVEEARRSEEVAARKYADLRARVVRGTIQRIAISNRGQAPAYDVGVTLTLIADRAYDLSDCMLGQPWNVPELAPGDDIAFDMAPAGMEAPPYDVTITYRDDASGSEWVSVVRRVS
jgi:hypothetical protein